MQARVFSWRQVKPGFPFALKHHAIGADVEITAIGIAGNDTISGASITSTIQWPVLGDRQLRQIDLIARESILVKSRL